MTNEENELQGGEEESGFVAEEVKGRKKGKGPFIQYAGRVAGVGNCIVCGKEGVSYKINSGGHLYAFCPSVENGGCGYGGKCTDIPGNAALASHIRKWNETEMSALARALPKPKKSVAPTKAKSQARPIAQDRRESPPPAPRKSVSIFD